MNHMHSSSSGSASPLEKGFDRVSSAIEQSTLRLILKDSEPTDLNITKLVQSTLFPRQWPEVSDFIARFSHVALVRKHTDMRELHVFHARIV